MREYATHEPEAPKRRRAEAPPPHALLALQRGAGNQAVVRHLARLTAPPGEERLKIAIELASIAELKTMLEDLQAGAAQVRLPLETVTISETVKWRFKVRAKLHARSMEALADSRRPLMVAMQGAGTDADRRTRTVALRAHDAPFLADIQTYALNAQTRYKHEDRLVQDGVLAAIQLEAVANAEGDLAAPKDAHEKAYKAAGMSVNDQWCGFFAMESYLQTNLDADLKRGFFHTANLEHYFTYRYAFGKLADTRVMKWIYAEGQWHDLRAYHTARGSVRTWIDAAQIFAGGTLDIRPGDIVTLDHSKDAEADHIMMVQSYDPATNTLFTVGGNDGGYEVDPAQTHKAPAGETAAKRDKRERLEAVSGQPLREGGGGKVAVNSFDLDDQPAAPTGKTRVLIYGIGRPSIVDLEDHRYDSTRADRPPATL